VSVVWQLLQQVDCPNAFACYRSRAGQPLRSINDNDRVYVRVSSSKQSAEHQPKAAAAFQ
jgi:hypothetical protein